MFAYVLLLLAVQMLLKAQEIPELNSHHPEDNGTWHDPGSSGNEVWTPGEYLEYYEDYAPENSTIGDDDPRWNSIEY